MIKRLMPPLLLTLLLLEGVAACGGSDSSNASPTPTATASSSSPTSNAPPSQLVSVITSLSPNSFAGVICGSTTTFTFTSVITVNAGSAGGLVSYIWTIGSSHIPGQVTFASGQTNVSVTYALRGVADANAADISGSLSATLNNKTISSSPVSVSGICSYAGKFQVTSIGISVSPVSVSGYTCNTIVTFTYTATVTIAPNSNGGVVNLQWGHSPNPTTLLFGPYAPGQTVKTSTFTLTGKILRNGIYPPPESVSSTSPNGVTSAAVKPYGIC